MEELLVAVRSCEAAEESRTRSLIKLHSLRQACGVSAGLVLDLQHLPKLRVRVHWLVRVAKGVARKSLLMRKPRLLEVLRRLRARLARRWGPLLPLAVEPVEPCEVLLLLLDLRVGVVLSIFELLDGLLVLLDLDAVFLIIRVEDLDDRLFGMIALQDHVPLKHVPHALFLVEVHRLVALAGEAARRAAFGIHGHVLFHEAYPITEHLGCDVLVEVDVHLPNRS